MYLLSIIPDDATIHPLSKTFENHFVIYLSKSPSRNMPTVLGLMKKAVLFSEQDIQGNTYYAAAFPLHQKTTILLSPIIEMAKNWKGFHLFFNGVFVNNHFGVLSTLSCFSQAMNCRDPKAHCNIIQVESEYVATNTFFGGSKVKRKTWLIPCQKLSYFYDKIDERLPSSIPDQIQAYAVQQSCDWCPLLNLNGFKILK